MLHGRRGALPAAASLCASGACLAHSGGEHAAGPVAGITLDPWLLTPLLLGPALYAAGLRRLWKTGIGHGVPPARAACFCCGWLVLLLSLVWPLDALAEWSLALHMTQHMLLMAVAPPLLLLGLPGATGLAALPAATARATMRPFRRGPASVLARALGSPAMAMVLQAAVMWGWHLPAAMEAALHSDALHITMHASFLLAGLLFWWALLRSLREPGAGAGAGLVAVVGTMMQMGLLGALMTFADTPRYAHYLERAPHLGVTALEDQQLAGLIMWVPAALPYLIGGVLLAAAWFARSERRQRAH